jgi:hypothetical protein
VVSFPSPDYWMPLPAAASRPAVLGRRWTHNASASSAPRRDYWLLPQVNSSHAPVLERHWACGVPLPNEATPTGADNYLGETVTPTTKSPEPPIEHAPLPDEGAMVIPGTVTLTPIQSPLETVTRLCVGCGKPLVDKRPQAKAHGVACRQRAYRRRKKEAAQAQVQKHNGRRSQPEPAALAAAAVGSAPR